MVRVHVLEAQELKAMDMAMMGLVKGKSDPYAVLKVGNQHFQTKTIQKTLNPRWNEVYEVMANACFAYIRTTNFPFKSMSNQHFA